MNYIMGACIGIVVWVIVLCLSVLVRKIVKWAASKFKINDGGYCSGWRLL